MLDFSKLAFDYEPYPIGLAPEILQPAFYDRLCAAYPPVELFDFKPALGNKYSLSEVNNAAKYREFIKSSAEWSQFHAHVKSSKFVSNTLELLREHHIDLGLGHHRIVSGKSVSSRASALSLILRITELSARFEFSMMAADGGHILPHTDSSNKLVTLVLSMLKPHEWNPAWGGGTDIVMPRNRRLVYNQANRALPFSEVEVIKTFPFNPNQCVIFVKTYNSWHSVSPMLGVGSGQMRKTLTINIEAKT